MFQIAAAGFCFGFLGVFGKWAYAQGLGTGQLLSLRFLCACAIFGPWLWLRHGRAGLALGRAHVLRSLALGVFGYALFSSCYFAALRGLSVSLCVLLLYAYPLWVLLGDAVFFGERLSRAQSIAFCVLLAGLVLLLWGDLRARDALSLALGVGSSVFYAGYILASRHWLRGVPALASSFYVMLGAGVTLAALQLRAAPAGGEAWLAVLALAVVGTILPVSMFLAGLQKLRASEASMLSLVEPFTGVLAGALVLGDSLTASQAVGAVIVLAGLALVAKVS
jgi:drug/metabolite transporter (DMT)-like permease